MSRRKNLAVAMAGAMVATSVVPAFAADLGIKDAEEKYSDLNDERTIEKDSDDLDKLYDDLDDLLDVKYENDKELNPVYADKSVYEIREKDTSGKFTSVISNTAELDKKVKDLSSGEKLEIKIVDRGHRVDENSSKVLAYKTKDSNTQDKYSNDDKVFKLQVENDIKEAKDNIESFEEIVDITENGFTIRNKSDHTVDSDITMEKGGNRKNFKEVQTKGTDLKVGKVTEFDISASEKYTSAIFTELQGDISSADKEDSENIMLQQQDDGSVIVKIIDTVDTKKEARTYKVKPEDKKIDFSQAKEEAIASTPAVITQFKNKMVEENDTASKILDNEIDADIITISEAADSTVKASKIFDGRILNLEGKKILDLLSKDGTEAGDYKYYVKDGKYDYNSKDKKITMNIYKDKTGKGGYKEKLYKALTIEGTSVTEMNRLDTIFKNAGEYKTELLAGEDRFQTSIDIAKKGVSKEIYDGDNIVLVSSTAIVDGLTAGPLAAVKKAPILLTDKDGLTKATEDYIKDFNDEFDGIKLKDTTVYVVGGESVISEDVIKDLKDLGVHVERLAGDDRQETSLEVAKEIESEVNTIGEVYVVGANGEADAMSISPKASKQQAPILVAGLDSMSKNMLKFIDNENSEVNIIGGKSAISEDMEKELEKVDDDEEVVRVSGKDRFETNKNVINKYYERSASLTFAVAKDSYNGKDNKELVDALAAGPFLATQDNGKAFLVLATDDKNISSTMEDVIDNKLASNASEKGKIFQIGAGVKSGVIKVLADKIGLK